MRREAIELKFRNWIEPQRTQRAQKWVNAVMVAEKAAINLAHESNRLAAARDPRTQTTPRTSDALPVASFIRGQSTNPKAMPWAMEKLSAPGHRQQGWHRLGGVVPGNPADSAAIIAPTKTSAGAVAGGKLPRLETSGARGSASMNSSPTTMAVIPRRAPTGAATVLSM